MTPTTKKRCSMKMSPKALFAIPAFRSVGLLRLNCKSSIFRYLLPPLICLSEARSDTHLLATHPADHSEH